MGVRFWQPQKSSLGQQVPVQGGFAPPSLISHDFEDGTIDGFTNDYGTDIDVVNDPTSRATGKVCRIHYTAAAAPPDADINRAIHYSMTGAGQSVYSRHKFAFPSGMVNPEKPFVQRKLLYFYGGANPNNDFQAVVAMRKMSDGIYIIYTYNNGGSLATISDFYIGTGALALDTWYTLEAQWQPNSTASATDGIFRVWFNGTLLLDRTGLQFTAPSYGGTMQCWRVRFGDQREGDLAAPEGAIDEYRYLDDCALSRTRIGP